jgi:predicted transcriptional regulator
MDADLADRLERHAHRARSTKTAIIAAALEEYLGEHDPPTELAFIGIGRSEHGRLSLDGRSIVRRDVGRRRPGA